MTVDGTIDSDKELTGAAVLSYIKNYHEGELHVVKVKENSVVIKVTGKMIGTYGLRASYTT